MEYWKDDKLNGKGDVSLMTEGRLGIKRLKLPTGAGVLIPNSRFLGLSGE